MACPVAAVADAARAREEPKVSICILPACPVCRRAPYRTCLFISSPEKLRVNPRQAHQEGRSQGYIEVRERLSIGRGGEIGDQVGPWNSLAELNGDSQSMVPYEAIHHGAGLFGRVHAFFRSLDEQSQGAGGTVSIQ